MYEANDRRVKVIRYVHNVCVAWFQVPQCVYVEGMPHHTSAAHYCWEKAPLIFSSGIQHS